MIELAIVIACRNGVEYTRQHLLSVLAAANGDRRVILVDTGCTDDTIDQAAAICGLRGVPFTAIASCEPNLSKAWNRGIAEGGECPFVAVLNNDTVACHDAWWEVVRRHFANRPETWCASGDCIGNTFTGDVHDHARGLAGSDGFSIAAGWLPGYFMLFRGEALRTLGGFDERFQIWYGDTDMERRLTAAGHPPVILHGCPIIHFGSKTTPTVPGYAETIAQDRRRFGEKHP